MSESYQKWLKQKLEKLQAIDCYSAGATPETVAKQLGVTTKQIIKLNFNENLFIPRVKQAKLMKELSEEIDLRMYPEDEEVKLREKLTGYIKVPKDFLVVGNASDELIDRIIRLFIEKGDIAISFEPTFSIPRLCVKRQEGEYITVPLLSNLQLDVKEMLSKFSDKTRLLYLCSPNSPTATQYKPEDIESLVKAFPGIVILDEAYGEFADYSFVPRIREFENMIILRTFSKAFGLAALRLGYAVANPELAKILTEKTPLPYPVSGFTLRLGSKMLDNVDIMMESVRQTKKERARLIKALNEIEGVQAFDSQANFVLMNTQKPCDIVNQKLLWKGIMVKKWGKILQYENCFRVTVGLPEMNAKLIEALKEIEGEDE
ncbi:MAG: histidinol-phosphate transaminase [Chloroflexi bacterium]|nr:histidinol-phosphate transaminase [Chloroflexota bacterium]MCL5948975.1 histidinol-phosphate transaminase [Candidatus Bathyarchaeota archaeon]